MTKGGISLGAGDDTMSIGKNTSVVLEGRYQNIDGGGNNSVFTMDKGSYVECNKLQSFNGGVELNVDSVLNNICDNNLSGNAVTKMKADIVGVVDLVLSGNVNGDVAGAKVVVHGIAPSSPVTNAWDFKVDGEQICNSLTNLGSGNSETVSKQIRGEGNATDADDVWAALRVSNYDLVVAWGRNEAEVGAALEAFETNKATLSLGDAVVSDAAKLADNGATANDFDKKDKGTLA